MRSLPLRGFWHVVSIQCGQWNDSVLMTSVTKDWLLEKRPIPRGKRTMQAMGTVSRNESWAIIWKNQQGERSGSKSTYMCRNTRHWGEPSSFVSCDGRESANSRRRSSRRETGLDPQGATCRAQPGPAWEAPRCFREERWRRSWKGWLRACTPNLEVCIWTWLYCLAAVWPSAT